jgi:HD-GYP domain-containing protein (c-di-GMP phosphodiesterase class II)
MPFKEGDPASIQEQLRAIHLGLKQELPHVDRIAAAIYDRETDVIKTFVHSTEGEMPFALYEAVLADVPSLQELARLHKPRVIADLQSQRGLAGYHNRRLIEVGYRSSYTEPFYDRGELYGFLFFDSTRKDYFGPTITRHLRLYAHLVELMIINALAPAHELRSAVDFAREVSKVHDEETGSHLDRMARYARLIARSLAARYKLDDEFVEFVFLFAPMHDVGKIGIPDRILMKAGPLSADEKRVMETHVSKGVQIIDMIGESFGVRGGQHFCTLRNIVEYHHEACDGSGYLKGLTGEEIPLEARIVTVADVFDALTTERAYKPAWSNDKAFSLLDDLAGSKFDQNCVDALIDNRPKVELIQQRFRQAKGEFEGFHEAYMDGI